jgi:hypothetical protein
VGCRDGHENISEPTPGIDVEPFYERRRADEAQYESGALNAAV